ncbi:MAG TPA: hypothetical protein PL168_06595 [Methanobacterium sp.]|jgi:hypothetical protein|nr:hypothetical protein [Methanobacterium sp.]
MNKSKTTAFMGLFIIIVVIISSGCTLDTGSLINQKNEKTDDIVQFTVNIAESNNNSCHVTGLVENKVDKRYRFVNMTVIGYNNKKEAISETKIMVPEVSGHDYATYEVWLVPSTADKITSVRLKFINGTKG